MVSSLSSWTRLATTVDARRFESSGARLSRQLLCWPTRWPGPAFEPGLLGWTEDWRSAGSARGSCRAAETCRRRWSNETGLRHGGNST